MAMFIKMAAAAAAAAVVFSFSAAADAAQTLRVGSLTVYAPFEYVNSQNGETEDELCLIVCQSSARHI